ncbi:MAG: type IV pilus assembly protein PilM [Planctomycetaceae bacterium]|nr:type IV pilus assembly protein PilM [Planctomycetaceae bacterium]
MAESQGVWGIEIGQAGLKAIRLRYADAAEQALAVAFDYIPHPKILSQPDAIPEELIPQALEKFLQRNNVKGDKLAISVPGNTSLLKFIKLPPVEASKVAEIVKYEARQQIPFALEDVIWDYQPLSGGADEDTGFMLDAEVGLFAMKREQVMQQLKPFTDEKLEVDVIQSAPLAIFNAMLYDQLGIRGQEDDAEPGEEHLIIIDMGADNTTMLVTNGGKIWVRNIPIGGNHFTRALSKEMKLTFAKAEHLKCNATKSPDPRAVFQALRPVFNDFVAEIQRSIGYFSSVNRDAKISKVVGVGNGFKMAGLQKFLEQNLQHEVVRLNRFQGLVGDSVLSDPLFEENILTFAVPYGLAIQALEKSYLKTTLLPPEIVRARMIRHKKPWAVAAAATLLFGFALSAFGYANVYDSVSVDRFGDDSTGAIGEAKKVVQKKSGFESSYGAQKSELDGILSKEDQLVEPLDTREYWLEVYAAINACLPRPLGDEIEIENIEHKKRIKLSSITCEKQADLATWFSDLSEREKTHMAKAEQETPTEGEGYVFTLVGYHYYNDTEHDAENSGVQFVVNTLLNNLQSFKVVPKPGWPEVPVGQIGISHPTILQSTTTQKMYDKEGYLREMNRMGAGTTVSGFGAPGGEYGAGPGGGEGYGETPGAFGASPAPGFGAQPGFPGRPGIPGGAGVPGLNNLALPEESTAKPITRLDFVLQFVWKPTPVEERLAEEPVEGAEDADAQE